MNLITCEEYISPGEFKDVYEQARQTRAAVRGFINYLKKYEGRKPTNREPDNLSSYKYSIISKRFGRLALSAPEKVK